MNLSKDLIRSIGFLVAIEEILNFRLVCWKFNDALSLDYYWFKRIQMDFPKYILEPKNFSALQLYKCLYKFKQFQLPLCQVDVDQVEKYLDERYQLSNKFQVKISEETDLSGYGKSFEKRSKPYAQGMIARFITWSRCKSLTPDGCFHLDVVYKEKEFKFRLVVDCKTEKIQTYIASKLFIFSNFCTMIYQLERLIYLTEPTFYIWNEYVSWSKFEECFKSGSLSLNENRLCLNPALNDSISRDLVQVRKTIKSHQPNHIVTLEFDQPQDILFELDEIGLYRGVPTRLQKSYNDLTIKMTCLCDIDATFINEIVKMFLEYYDLTMITT